MTEGVPLTRRTVPGEGNRPALAYVDVGSREPQAVVLLHSLGTDHRLWRHQLDGLAQGHRVLAPDARGHGASGWTGPDVTIGDWVDDLDAVLDDAEVSSAAVVGLSMGGVQALAYALSRPERVWALVLADTFAELSPEVATTKSTTLAAQARAGMTALASDYLDVTLTQPSVSDTDRQALHEAIASVPAEAYAASTRACFTVQLQDRLPEVTRPTLVIWGACDEKTPRELSYALAAGIPGARLEIVPDAGHLSAIENPQQFTYSLARFLDEARATTDGID